MPDQLDSTQPQVDPTAGPDDQTVGQPHAVALPPVSEVADAVTDPFEGVAESGPAPMGLLA